LHPIGFACVCCIGQTLFSAARQVINLQAGICELSLPDPRHHLTDRRVPVSVGPPAGPIAPVGTYLCIAGTPTYEVGFGQKTVNTKNLTCAGLVAKYGASLTIDQLVYLNPGERSPQRMGLPILGSRADLELQPVSQAVSQSVSHFSIRLSLAVELSKNNRRFARRLLFPFFYFFRGFLRCSFTKSQ
jgi:hypothetical protein